MQFRFLGIIMILMAHTTIGQILSVKDFDTKEPLAFVNIIDLETNTFTTADAEGKSDIGIFSGISAIEIRLLGYRSLTTTFAELERKKFVVLLKPDHFSLDEMVVTASKWGQSKRDIPNKMGSISPKEAALLNPQTAADLLGATGEVFIQKSQQGGGSPMIRGFSSNRLLYTVDGVRMNTAIFRAGNIQNVISLDPMAMESTEVFFGPGSIIYGSDAIGGVMGFRTLKPKFATDDAPKISGKGVIRHSTANNEFTGHLDVNLGLDKWASVTSFTTANYGDLLMGSHGPDDYLQHFYVQRVDSTDRVVTNEDPQLQTPTGFSQINFMQKLRFSPNEHWDFEWGYHYSETTPFARYDRLTELAPNGQPRSAVWNYGPQIWSMNNLAIHYNKSNRMFDRASLRLAHQHFEESRIDRNFSGSNRFRLREQVERVDAYSLNLDFQKYWDRNQLFYGIEALINDVDSRATGTDIRSNASIDVPDRYPNSIWSSYAAYISYQQKVSTKVLLQSGIRYSYNAISSDFSRHLSFFPFDFTESKLNNGATTGSLGAVFTPNSDWIISTNISTGFRAPNVDDIGKLFDFMTGDVVVPNAGLRAEYAYNAEINVMKIFGSKLKLDFTGFYTLLDNAMVRREFQVDGNDSIFFNGTMSKVYAIQNAATANVYGFHVGIDATLGKGFSFSSKFNYQLGEEEMDDGSISRSRHAAPYFGIARINYTHEKLTMQWNVHFSGGISFENLNEEERQKPVIYAKDADGNPFSPGWATLNFKAMYRWSESFQLSAGLENITDKRYRPYSSALTAPGRNFVISMIGRF